MANQESKLRTLLRAVRTKLTAAFLGIILLFSVATLAADRGFRGVRASLDEIHGETLPEVFALKEVGIRIPAVLRLQAAVPYQRTHDRLEAIEVAIATESVSVAQAVEASGDGASRMQPLLASMDTSTRALIGAQDRHLEARLLVKERQARFDQEVNEIALALEAELVLAQGAGRNADGIRDLMVQLFALLGDTRSYSDIADENALAGAERRYELARRESVRFLTTLPKAQREERAKELLNLIVGSASEDSLLSAQRDVLGTSEEVDVQVAAGREIGVKLQSLAGEYVAATRLGIESSRTVAQRAAVRSQQVVFWLWLSAFLASALILWLYVQRRVARPLEHLADDLTRLSEGDLDVEVRRGGDHEIAQVSRVAEVFRQNARELRTTMGTLETRNATLTEFAYVASHDLKSPLRAISNLAGWIREDAADVLSKESTQHLGLLSDRVVKMETLLEELLRYARLGNDKKLVEMLSLDQVVVEVVDLLALPSSVEVLREGTERSMETIAAPLKLCLRNLIQNAVKYSDRDEPKIVVSAQPGAAGFLEIAIRDDGPGIPVHQREEAVRIFRKLGHGDDGVGMGLALTKRAVELIGGSLSIESATPRGAKIVLSWPNSAVAGER